MPSNCTAGVEACNIIAPCILYVQIWPEDEYPLKPVGTLVLDRNPTNYFAQMEQIAFSPANMIPGIEPSPDKLLQVIYIFKSLDQLFG